MCEIVCDFSSLSSFTRTVKKVDLSELLMCFKYVN